MNLFDREFDIRRMTISELKNFTHDFMREIADAVHAGIMRPH